LFLYFTYKIWYKYIVAKTILIAITLLLILGLGGLFFYSKIVAPANILKATPVPLAAGEETASSLNELLASNTSRTCTFSNEGDEGVVYVSSGKARLEFEASFSDGKIYNKYHMIVSGERLYIWIDEGKSGFLTLLEILSANATPPPPKLDERPVSTGGFLSDANYGYTCTAWLEDSSVFTLPQDVVFIPAGLSSPDPSQTNTGSGTSSKCAVCETLIDEAKSICKSDLNCP
jgi:hypothetical protein